MGKWKCIWCSKVLEGESFMDLIAASAKEEGSQHVHGWENLHAVEVPRPTNEPLPNPPPAWDSNEKGHIHGLYAEDATSIGQYTHTNMIMICARFDTALTNLTLGTLGLKPLYLGLKSLLPIDEVDSAFKLNWCGTSFLNICIKLC